MCVIIHNTGIVFTLLLLCISCSVVLRREPPLFALPSCERQLEGVRKRLNSHPLPALVSRLNVNFYRNHSIKKLLELRQQKAALKTQMRSMLEKADSEKRSLNEEEGKKFDELRAQADALEVEITRLEAVANDQRNPPGTSVEGEPVSNDELRHYIMTVIPVLSPRWCRLMAAIPLSLNQRYHQRELRFPVRQGDPPADPPLSAGSTVA